MISIIVPVYNVADYLPICLSSILHQTFSDFELILVDDGSTDGSGEICDGWALKDKRIKVIHKQNGGLSSARNAGLDVARGEYISFIDSDDYVASDMLNKLKRMFDLEPGVDVSVCVMNCFTEISHSKCRQKSFLKYKKNAVFSSSRFLKLILNHKVDNAVCNKLYKKASIGNIRFETGKINEDILFNVQVLMSTKIVSYLSEPLYFYRIRSGSITQQANPKMFDFILNSFQVKEMVIQCYGTNLRADANGYIFYEMTNYIATLLKYNSIEANSYNVLCCKKYLYKHFPNLFLNKSWGIFMKAKCLLVCIFPSIYCSLLKLKK